MAMEWHTREACVSGGAEQSFSFLGFFANQRSMIIDVGDAMDFARMLVALNEEDGGTVLLPTFSSRTQATGWIDAPVLPPRAVHKCHLDSATQVFSFDDAGNPGCSTSGGRVFTLLTPAGGCVASFDNDLDITQLINAVKDLNGTGTVASLLPSMAAGHDWLLLPRVPKWVLRLCGPVRVHVAATTEGGAGSSAVSSNEDDVERDVFVQHIKKLPAPQSPQYSTLSFRNIREGMHIVTFGDFYELPPVGRRDEDCYDA